MAVRKSKHMVFVVLAVCLVFLAITTISALAADHDCTGESCVVCLFSSGIKLIFMLAARAAVITATLTVALLCACGTLVRRSLVSNKIKLNN